MYCVKCGTELSQSANFCVNCGAKIAVAQLDEGATPDQLLSAGSEVLFHWAKSDINVYPIEDTVGIDFAKWSAVELVVSESAIILTHVDPPGKGIEKASVAAAYTLGPIASLLVSGVGSAFSESFQKRKFPAGTYTDQARLALFRAGLSIFAEMRTLRPVHVKQRSGLFTAGSSHFIADGRFLSAGGEFEARISSASPSFKTGIERGGKAFETQVVPDIVEFLIKNLSRPR